MLKILGATLLVGLFLFIAKPPKIHFKEKPVKWPGELNELIGKDESMALDFMAPYTGTIKERPAKSLEEIKLMTDILRNQSCLKFNNGRIFQMESSLFLITYSNY